MMPKTTPSKERAVKVYELDAVVSEMSHMKDEMVRMSKKMDTLIDQTAGIVTCAQLEKTKQDILDEVDLKYGPVKSDMKWFSRTAIGAVIIGSIGIIFQIIAMYGKFGS